MKNIKYILSALMLAWVVMACEDEGKNTRLNINSPALLSFPENNTAYVLVEEDQDKPLAPITWSAADFGFEAATTYQVEVDKSDGDFSAPAVVSTTNELEAILTVGEFNSLLKLLDIEVGQAANLKIRVVASVNENVEEVISEPISISVVTFEALIVYPKIYVPGAHNGWDPSNEFTALYSKDFNDKYEGYIQFDANNLFKFTPAPNWDTDWGDDGADGSLDVKGANIEVAAAGYYKVNVDVAALTYSLEAQSWGVIGDATPGEWATDTDFTYDAANNVLTVTLDLVGGKQIKFRANDDWGVNYGDLEGDGILDTENDNNINIAESGNYTITLNFGNGPVYSYTLVKN